MKAALALLLFCSGCATLVTRVVDPEYGDQVYPATRIDLCGFAYLLEDQKKGGDEYHCLAVLPAVDLPFSLVTDTVLLPVDLAVMGWKARKE